MLASIIVVSSALTALTAAMPAGGPIATSIPPTCTTSDPMPTSTGVKFVPASSLDSDQLYAAHYPPFSSNATFMSEQCLQQCYGYGDHTECKAAYWANNFPNESGDLMAACLFYTRAIKNTEWTPAPTGQATDAYARNLEC